MTAAVMDRTFDELCEVGREAMDNLDDGRWQLGELAQQIETQYNEHTIAEFAKQIGAEKSRVYEYRKVYGFYSNFLPVQKFRADNVMLRYSHYREAMRLKTADKVLDWLNEVNTNGYTVEEARVKLCKRLGKPAPPMKLLEFGCDINEIDEYLPTGTDITEIWKHKQFIIRVYTIDENEVTP